MAESFYIQAYVKCNREKFASILTRFKCVLSEIGFDSQYLFKSFDGLVWKVSDNGFMYTGCNAEPVKVNLFGELFTVRPLVLGLTPGVYKQLKEPWLEIDLLLDPDEIESPKFKIKDEIKNPLWSTMVHLSNYFYESGVYLTDEGTDGLPWKALLGCNNHIWSFYAAIVPASIAKAYNPLHRDYHKKEEDGKLLMINKDAWGKVPWQ